MRFSIFLFFLSGCLHPLPTWQRGRLMTQVMEPSISPLADSFQQHVLDSREGMTGGTGSGGIPCGCN